MTATIQQIFLLGYSVFEKTRPLPDFIRKAAHCIMVCRTAVLGGHTQSCPDGHFHRVWYNSCKHRMCPQCAYVRIQQWLAKQKARILKCDHFHVIFTIPHELNPIWRLNANLMAHILFTCARDSLFELLGDDKYLGAKPGIIASIHTWSKTLILHPHIHCLVTGGGLTSKGEWKNSKNDFLLPFDVLKINFRKRVKAAILSAANKNKLHLPKDMSPQKLINLLNKLGRKKWSVRICEKYAHGNGVLTYLARYIRGGPISNKRIIRIENGKVFFNCGRKKVDVMELPIVEFTERYLQHIPPQNAIWVRSYGLYANSCKAKIEKCREILGQEPVGDIVPIDWQSHFEKSDQHPECCPTCGKRLIVSSIIDPIPLNQCRRDPPNNPLTITA